MPDPEEPGSLPPAPSCEPFFPCPSLDGRLLINRIMHGPPLGYEEAEIPFGSLRLNQVSSSSYFNVCVNAVWTPLEACYGPVRSIFGLAPGETVTLHVRDRREESRDERSVEQTTEGTTTSTRFGNEIVANVFTKAEIGSSSSSENFGISSSSSHTYQWLLGAINTTVIETLSAHTNSEVTEELVQTYAFSPIGADQAARAS